MIVDEGISQPDQTAADCDWAVLFSTDCCLGVLVLAGSDSPDASRAGLGLGLLKELWWFLKGPSVGSDSLSVTDGICFLHYLMISFLDFPSPAGISISTSGF